MCVCIECYMPMLPGGVETALHTLCFTVLWRMAISDILVPICYILRAILKHFGIILAAFWQHFGSILAAFEENFPGAFLSSLGVFMQHFASFLIGF